MFLEVSLTYQLFYFFLELVEDLNMMSFDFIELASSYRFRPLHSDLGGRQCLDVVQVGYLALDLFSTGIQRRETFYRFPHSFERGFTLHGRYVIVFPWEM